MARAKSFISAVVQGMAGTLAVRRPGTRTAGLAVGAVLGLAAAGAPLAAKASPILLVEAETGRVLEQREAGKPWYPASVTKLMTVYVALHAVKSGRLGMDTPLTVTSNASSQQPSKIGFKPGTQVTLDNALKMLMVKSANDIAVVVAEGVGGSVPGFVSEMNAVAQHLGMTGTHFANPHGLPNSNQVTTARDLAILARALIYHFPEHEDLFRIPAIRLGNKVMRNYNRLIDQYPGADGMKTGFICDSGFNLVATATRGNRRLIAVVLGAPSAVNRTENTALLLEKGFRGSGGGLFGGGQTLSSIQNTGGAPISMRGRVCGADRVKTAGENEDELVGRGSPFSNLPASGAELLQKLPPSMPPVLVYAGTRDAPVDPETVLYGAGPKRNAKTTKTAERKKTTGSNKPAPKPAPKPAQRPQ